MYGMKKVYGAILLFIVLFTIKMCAQGEIDARAFKLDSRRFQIVINGDSVDLFKLRNDSGMEVDITNYGGRVVALFAKDKTGDYKDVVLGHESIKGYLELGGCYGALIGRYANRIGYGVLEIDGKSYRLPQNCDGHCLHGGFKGFHNVVWKASQLSDSVLTLRRNFADGEDGFPGNIMVEVTYTLRADNALKIEYRAQTDAPTVINLTNHAYFNLSGNPGQDILKHIAQIDASRFTLLDSVSLPTGELVSVSGTPFDFRNEKTIGKDIKANNQQLKAAGGYDHNFVLDHPGDLTKEAARFYSPDSGIQMSVFTTEPGLQLYTENSADGSIRGKKNIAYGRHGAFCVETQHFPDSPHQPHFPSTLLKPSQPFYSQTIYKFSIIK